MIYQFWILKENDKDDFGYKFENEFFKYFSSDVGSKT